MIWLPFGNPEWLSTVPTPGGHAGKPKRASGWADWPLGPVALTPDSVEIGQKYQAPFGQE